MKRILGFAFTLIGLSTGQAHAAALGAGCDTSRTAVAFHSDGSPADALGAPVPCAVATGFGGAESRMAVAPDGDLMETPAILGVEPTAPGQPTPEVVLSSNSGIGWSQNGGRPSGTWSRRLENVDPVIR